MAANGILSKLRKNNYPVVIKEEAQSESKVFKLVHLQGHILILVGGIVLSFLALLAELVVKAIRSAERKRKDL